MLSRDKIIKTIQENTAQIRLYGVRKMGIFGSFAKTNQNPKSDIDVLVEFDRGNKTFDNYMELKFYLEKLFHRKVDLVIKDALKTSIKNRVLAEVKYA